MLTRSDATPVPAGGSISVNFEGRTIAARPGDSVAAALLAAGITVTRRTPVGAAPRAVMHCMMGACFDCLAVVDGRPNVWQTRT